jgi:hypothetical protein
MRTPVHHKRKSRKSSHTHVHSSSKRGKDLLSDAYTRLKAGQPVVASHAGHMGHEGGALESVREVEYNGHKIVIRTSYEIKVDGKSLSGHMFVGNSGRVYSHAMPAYSFPSTVDLVKNLIDTFPASFPKKTRPVLKQRKGGR